MLEILVLFLIVIKILNITTLNLSYAVFIILGILHKLDLC